MSFELAGKIKELARIALEAKTKVDALEARVKSLETDSIHVSTVPITTNELLAGMSEKRKPGRPRKVV